MKILIVEDDHHAALRLRSILNKIDPRINILQVCKSNSETLEWFKKNEPPDLLFLDIQLSDGISFDLFNSINIQCPIIFVTAFNNYAIEAFKVNSIDYILKPYNQKDIKKAIEKYNSLHNKQSYNIDKSVISELLNSLIPKYKSRFFAKINHTVYSISIDEILSFNFEDNATIVVRNDNRSFVINYSLNNLEQYLEPKQFFRINRKTIINIDSIKKMNVLSKSRIEVILKNNAKELISRSKTTDFKTWLDI